MKQLWRDKSGIEYTVTADRKGDPTGAVLGFFYEHAGVTEWSPLHPETRRMVFVRVLPSGDKQGDPA